MLTHALTHPRQLQTYEGVLWSKIVVTILLIPSICNIIYRLLSTRGTLAATMEFAKTENWLSAFTILSVLVSTVELFLLPPDFHDNYVAIETPTENGTSALKIHSMLFLRLLRRFSSSLLMLLQRFSSSLYYTPPLPICS